VHAGLAEATSESDLLAAAMRYLGRTRPSSAHFIRLHVDADGRVERGELAAIWQHGQIHHQHAMLGAGVPMSLLNLTVVWRQNPSEIIAVSDVSSDPRADASIREQLGKLGQSAMVLVPLYSRAHRSWHGVLVVFWALPHALSPEEHSVYSLLSDAVASFAANLHIQRSLREVFEETSLLYDVSSRLNQANTTDEALRAISIAAPGAAYAFLGILERNSDGEAVQLRVAAGWAPQADMVKSVVGMNFPVALVPMMNLWMNDPEHPLLISDVETDPRVDPHARMLYRQGTQRCAALLPLVVRGQVIGNVSIAWQDVRPFSARDERIYQSIAKHASLVLQNRLLIEESQAALRDRAAGVEIAQGDVAQIVRVRVGRQHVAVHDAVAPAVGAGPPLHAATGTPTRSASCLAAILSPRARMTSAGGPMKTTPSRSQSSGNRGSSATNPQPTHAASARPARRARSSSSRSR